MGQLCSSPLQAFPPHPPASQLPDLQVVCPDANSDVKSILAVVTHCQAVSGIWSYVCELVAQTPNTGPEISFAFSSLLGKKGLTYLEIWSLALYPSGARRGGREG